MNKQSGSLFKNILITVIFIASVLFIHVIILEESKELSMVIAKHSEILKAKKSLFETKIVEYQKLMTEERIVKFAEEKLGLQRNKKTNKSIRVDTNQLKKLKKIIRRKYD